MNIVEKMAKNSPIDQVEIGDIVDSALKGNFGEVLKQISESLKFEYIAKSERNTSIPADRVLGQIQGISALLERLDYCVDIKNQLKEEIKEEKVVK